LADATIAQNEQSRALETFLTNPSANEVDIVVQNVSLSELANPRLNDPIGHRDRTFWRGIGRGRDWRDEDLPGRFVQH
jgi:hypothetical protein